MATKYTSPEGEQFLRAVDSKLTWAMQPLADALQLLADHPAETTALEPWRECIHDAASTLGAAQDELRELVSPDPATSPNNEGFESSKNALRVYLENAIVGMMHLRANGHEITASQVLRLVLHELNSRGFAVVKDGVEYRNIVP
ncbi:hypothetical protein FACS1894154_06740 [Betaproteobacteria bacterium]|nr:hypothetical protein FACS1894154_06740 [Betaproteobacteria bacterium]GHU29384.1 hypothetical protein FACS189497_07260 [Betaproteobacteria bacterium]